MTSVPRKSVRLGGHGESAWEVLLPLVMRKALDPLGALPLGVGLQPACVFWRERKEPSL